MDRQKKRREGIPDRGDRRPRVWLKRVIKGWQDGGSMMETYKI